MQENNSNTITISFQSKPVGAITILNGQISLSSDLTDDTIINIIKDAQNNGIPYIEYVHNDSEHISIFKNLFPNDGNFIFELAKHIKESGYEIYEEVVKINNEVTNLLNLLPKDNKVKKEILDNLPKMSYLDKTYIKDKLEKKFDEFVVLASQNNK